MFSQFLRKNVQIRCRWLLKNLGNREKTSATNVLGFGKYCVLYDPSETPSGNSAQHGGEHVRPEIKEHSKGYVLVNGIKVPETSVPEWAYEGCKQSSRDLDSLPLVLHDTETARNGMRAAGKLARRMLDYACSLLKPNCTTAHVDARLREEILRAGAYPSPWRYRGFPCAICVAPNNIVAHGIPCSSRALAPSDIVSVDVSVFLHGYHGDCATTVCVGDEVDDLGKHLINVARQARDAGVDAANTPGATFGDIAKAVHTSVGGENFCISPILCGHGIGSTFHAAPTVHHTVADRFTTNKRKYDNVALRPGMAFTVEPVVIQGRDHQVHLWNDNWTLSTRNKARAAQFEHTLMVTESGVEILT